MFYFVQGTIFFNITLVFNALYVSNESIVYFFRIDKDSKTANLYNIFFEIVSARPKNF